MSLDGMPPLGDAFLAPVTPQATGCSPAARRPSAAAATAGSAVCQSSAKGSIVAAVLATAAAAASSSRRPHRCWRATTHASADAAAAAEKESHSRRRQVAALLATLGPLAFGGHSARAKKMTQDFKKNVAAGYKNISYLLDNWDEETTNAEGKRDPDKVRSALGMRSTKDPLFNLSKLLLEYADAVNPDFAEEYEDAVDKWNTAINGSNADAFISAFGEYNPGGGAETIEKYLERSRENVVKARKNLEVICKGLEIDL